MVAEVHEVTALLLKRMETHIAEFGFDTFGRGPGTIWNVELDTLKKFLPADWDVLYAKWQDIKLQGLLARVTQKIAEQEKKVVEDARADAAAEAAALEAREAASGRRS